MRVVTAHFAFVWRVLRSLGVPDEPDSGEGPTRKAAQ